MRIEKKLWNMKMTIIPIVIGAFDTVTKGLLKGLEDLEVGGRVETIQTTTLLWMVRILRRVLETWENLLSLKLQWKTSANADVKNFKRDNNNNNNNESENLINIINTKAIHLVRYSGQFFKNIRGKSKTNRSKDKKVDEYAYGLTPGWWHSLCVQKSEKENLPELRFA